LCFDRQYSGHSSGRLWPLFRYEPCTPMSPVLWPLFRYEPCTCVLTRSTLATLQVDCGGHSSGTSPVLSVDPQYSGHSSGRLWPLQVRALYANVPSTLATLQVDCGHFRYEPCTPMSPVLWPLFRYEPCTCLTRSTLATLQVDCGGHSSGTSPVLVTPSTLATLQVDCGGHSSGTSPVRVF
jgi:hypothetical protein